MKLGFLTLAHLRMPLVSAFETAFGRTTHRECILISLAAEGLIGYGECVADHDPGYSYETTGTAWHILRDFIAPAILGQDIPDAESYQRRVEGIRGHQLAKAGVEMAIWDLLGKRANKPLRELIGGERKQVDVGVSVGLQASTEKLVETVAEYVAQGYRRVKLKIKPGHDYAETLAVHKAFPNLLLQVDANSSYTLVTSEALLPLDDLGLLLIEQPLQEDDIWDHRRLQAQFKTSLCLDESIISMRHARYAIEMEACRIINVKPGRLGGLSQGIAVQQLCKSRGMPVWVGGMLETGVGRASNLALASLPGFTLPGDISASNRYYMRDITNERFFLNADSTIDVPTAPGLGVTLDPGAMKAYTMAETTIRS